MFLFLILNFAQFLKASVYIFPENNSILRHTFIYFFVFIEIIQKLDKVYFIFMCFEMEFYRIEKEFAILNWVRFKNFNFDFRLFFF